MRLHWREMKLSLRGEKTLDLEQRIVTIGSLLPYRGKLLKYSQQLGLPTVSGDVILQIFGFAFGKDLCEDKKAIVTKKRQ